jgi:hypothetical protein
MSNSALEALHAANASYRKKLEQIDAPLTLACTVEGRFQCVQGARPSSCWVTLSSACPTGIGTSARGHARGSSSSEEQAARVRALGRARIRTVSAFISLRLAFECMGMRSLCLRLRAKPGTPRYGETLASKETYYSVKETYYSGKETYYSLQCHSRDSRLWNFVPNKLSLFLARRAGLCGLLSL